MCHLHIFMQLFSRIRSKLRIWAVEGFLVKDPKNDLNSQLWVTWNIRMLMRIRHDLLFRTLFSLGTDCSMHTELLIKYTVRVTTATVTWRSQIVSAYLDGSLRSTSRSIICQTSHHSKSNKYIAQAFNGNSSHLLRRFEDRRGKQNLSESARNVLFITKRKAKQ